MYSICSTINSQWNKQEAVFFPAKGEEHVIDRTKKNKGQNIQTLQNRVVKENNFNKDVKIKKYAAVQLRISLRGKFFYEPLSTFTKNKP